MGARRHLQIARGCPSSSRGARQRSPRRGPGRGLPFLCRHLGSATLSFSLSQRSRRQLRRSCVARANSRSQKPTPRSNSHASPQSLLSIGLSADGYDSAASAASGLGLGGKLAGCELHLSNRGKVDLELRSGHCPGSVCHGLGKAQAWKAQGMKLSSLGISVMVARAISS